MYCSKCGGKNCGGNYFLARRRAWISAGFIWWVIDILSSNILVPFDLVLYAGPFVGAVDGLGMGFLGAVACACCNGFIFVFDVVICYGGLLRRFAPSEMVSSSLAPLEMGACPIVSVVVVLVISLESSEMCVCSLVFTVV